MKFKIRRIRHLWTLVLVKAIMMISTMGATINGSNNVTVNIHPVAPPGIGNGITTVIGYVDWAVLIAAIGAILVGVLHLTGVMGDSANAKKYLGGGILALILWAGLFAFINGLI